MTVSYTDPGVGGNVQIKSRIVGGAHVLARDIERLPGTVETDISNTRGFLQTLAGVVSSGRAAVDLSATVVGYLATLAGAITSGKIQSDVATLPGTIGADIATLAGAIASGNMKVALQAGSAAIGKLAANIGVNIGTVDVASLVAAQLPTALGQTNKAGSLSVALASNQDALPITDNAGSLTVDSAQLPASLGQKAMTLSLPVVLASDQASIPVSIGGGVTIDYDTGAGTQALGVQGIALPASGGAVAGGTSTNPLRTDPTGATTQPISAASLPLPLGAALDATLTGGTAQAIARGGAKGATAAASVTSTAEGSDHQAIDVQLYHGGTAKDPTAVRALTSADVVTAAQGTAAALSGAWPAKITDGTTGAAVKAASTAAVAADPALVVAISPNNTIPVGDAGGSLTVDGTVTIGTALPSGTNAIGKLSANSGVVIGSVDLATTPTANLATLAGAVASARMAVDLATTPTANLATIASDTTFLRTYNPALPAGTANIGDVDIASWVGGSTAPTVGQKTAANSIPVVIASDQAADTVATGTFGAVNDQIAIALAGKQSVNFKLVQGSSLVGSLVAEISYDAGSNYNGATVFVDPATGARSSTLSATAAGGSQYYQIYLPAGASHVRVRLFAYTSGTSSTCMLRAVDHYGVEEQNLFSWLGSSAPTVGIKAAASCIPVVLASDQAALPINDNAGSLTVDSPQLPAALVGSRLDVNAGAWLGSTAPTVGSKTSANSIPVVIASDQGSIAVTPAAAADTTSSGALGALNAAVTVALAGKQGAGFGLSASGTLVGTLTPEVSFDGGTTYVAATFFDPATGSISLTQAVTSGSVQQRGIIVPGGASHVRVRVSTYTSGTATGNIRASNGESNFQFTNGVKCATATATRVTSAASNTTLLAANTNRCGVTIYNESTAVLSVKFGSTSSATSYNVRINANSYYETPPGFTYTGIITGIWAAANGAAMIGEFTQ